MIQNSEAQKRAIVFQNGPAMILAGPGSGKTLVITRRTKQLIDTFQINPRDILVITFTKAAAAEMRARFQRTCSLRGVTFGTFHAVFFAILKQACHYTSENVMSETARRDLLRRLLRSLAVQDGNEEDMLCELASEISLVKNEMIPLEKVEPRSCRTEVFREIFRRYEREHSRQGLLDFDDMLTRTYELLTGRPDVLQVWQHRWRYILVDEFQDINRIQYEVLRLLAAPQDNLFVVGDDDQSIYGFRGARPEIMQQFLRDYPDAKRILLDLNFRSSKEIVEGAGKVIAKNRHRFLKDIRPVRSGGEAIDLQEFLNQDHESLYLVQQIQKSIREGIPGSEIAILVRTNRLAVPAAGRLTEFGIPFAMRDSLPDLYQHWIAKDLFAYFHLAFVGLDRGEFLRVMNRPGRGIGRESIREEAVSFNRLRSEYRGSDRMIRCLNRFESDLGTLGTLSPFAAINYIRLGMQYEEFLKSYAFEHRMDVGELTDVLDEIQENSRSCRTVKEWYDHIREYHLMLSESREKTKKKSVDAVTVSTLHASKGLEFAEVFLPDVNEGILPHRRCVKEADVEEERRLFYVGMTRAKDRLHIFYIRERYGKVMEPSEFLEPILL